MKKKAWSKPELVVLVRGRPEEVLTLNCKTNDIGTGPSATATHCNRLRREIRCNNCHAQAGTQDPRSNEEKSLVKT